MPRKGNRPQKVANRAAMMQRIKQNSQAAQQALVAKQAGGFVPLVQPLQAAQQQPPQPTPQPSNLPSAAQPPPTIVVPAVPVVNPPANQPKQRQLKAYGVPGGQVGPALPVGGKKALQQQGASTKLAKAQAAYQSRTDVQARIQRRQERQDRLQALGISQNLASGIQALPQATASRLESTPTPFGIALPLLLLLLLYLALIPVNGKSRLEWLWLTIIKQAYVTNAAVQQGEVTQPVVSAVGTGGYTPPGGNTVGGLVVNTPTGSYMYSGDDF